MKQEEYDKLQRAVTMYRNLTGESIDLGGVTVDKPQEDAAAKAQGLIDAQKRESEVQKAKEDADQKLRQLRLDEQRASGDGDTQAGQPGHPIPASQKAADIHEAGGGKAKDSASAATSGRGSRR